MNPMTRRFGKPVELFEQLDVISARVGIWRRRGSDGGGTDRQASNGIDVTTKTLRFGRSLHRAKYGAHCHPAHQNQTI